jgi:hypothetical protein
MPPNKPQSNYSKRPIKRIRLLKIGPRKTKSLFEEYFYGFLVVICLAVMILGKAGGLSGYDAVVTGLWVGGFTWSAWVLRRYRKEQTGSGSIEKSRQAVRAPAQLMNKPMPPNMKPMIGPQWPTKTAAGARPAATAQTPQTPAPPEKKRAFVYERPTLPDRKPKLPNNWAGQPDKKPKR